VRWRGIEAVFWRAENTEVRKKQDEIQMTYGRVTM